MRFDAWSGGWKGLFDEEIGRFQVGAHGPRSAAAGGNEEDSTGIGDTDTAQMMDGRVDENLGQHGRGRPQQYDVAGSAEACQDLFQAVVEQRRCGDEGDGGVFQRFQSFPTTADLPLSSSSI